MTSTDSASFSNSNAARNNRRRYERRLIAKQICQQELPQPGPVKPEKPVKQKRKPFERKPYVPNLQTPIYNGPVFGNRTPTCGTLRYKPYPNVRHAGVEKHLRLKMKRLRQPDPICMAGSIHVDDYRDEILGCKARWRIQINKSHGGKSRRVKGARQCKQSNRERKWKKIKKDISFYLSSESTSEQGLECTNDYELYDSENDSGLRASINYGTRRVHHHARPQRVQAQIVVQGQKNVVYLPCVTCPKIKEEDYKKRRNIVRSKQRAYVCQEIIDRKNTEQDRIDKRVKRYERKVLKNKNQSIALEKKTAKLNLQKLKNFAENDFEMTEYDPNILEFNLFKREPILYEDLSSFVRNSISEKQYKDITVSNRYFSDYSYLLEDDRDEILDHKARWRRIIDTKHRK